MEFHYVFCSIYWNEQTFEPEFGARYFYYEVSHIAFCVIVLSKQDIFNTFEAIVWLVTGNMEQSPTTVPHFFSKDTLNLRVANTAKWRKKKKKFCLHFMNHYNSGFPKKWWSRRVELNSMKLHLNICIAWSLKSRISVVFPRYAFIVHR